MPPSLITIQSFRFSLAILAGSFPDLLFWEVSQSLGTLGALPSAVTVAQLHNCYIMIREHQIPSSSVFQSIRYWHSATVCAMASRGQRCLHRFVESTKEGSNTTLNSSMYLKMSPYSVDAQSFWMLLLWRGKGKDDLCKEAGGHCLWYQCSCWRMGLPDTHTIIYEEKLQNLFSIQKNLNFRASLEWIAKTKANC